MGSAVRLRRSEEGSSLRRSDQRGMAGVVRGRRLPFPHHLGSVRVGFSPPVRFLRPVDTWGRVLEGMGQWLPGNLRPACAVLKGPFPLVAVRGSSLRQCDQLGTVGEVRDRGLHFPHLLGNVTGPMRPSRPVRVPLPVRTWERGVVVKGPSLPQCGQLGTVGEERDRELHSPHPSGSVTGPMRPSRPVRVPLPVRTWERGVVVKGPSLPQFGQREKALEARDPVRLGHGLELGLVREGQCTM